MQVVTEELSTALASMAIEDSKELDLELGLLRAIRLDAWFLQIKDNRDTVLVVVADKSVVSVSTVGDHIRQQSFLRNFSFFYDRTIGYLAHVLSFENCRVKFCTHGDRG